MSLLLAVASGYGVHLAWTAAALGWRGLGPGSASSLRQGRQARAETWLVQAGLEGVSLRQFTVVTLVVGLSAGALVAAVSGGPLPVVLAMFMGSTWPVAVYRGKRRHRRERAQEAWPRIIEEVRILTGSVGRSIPQALFEAGANGPPELRGAFEAAHREWALSTEFARSTAVLKARLADPTADAACETLLVAHEIGGVDLDRRLEALADDRIADVQGRRDARAQQAGVRFARRFVLIVPVGMAAAGMSLSGGRAAYQTAQGQLAVALGMALVAACWMWAGRIMRIPDEQRVFPS